MFVLWSETAAMFRAQSLFVCGVVKTERKRFQIKLMQLDGTNVLRVLKMTVDELYALFSVSQSSRYCSGKRREELLELK